MISTHSKMYMPFPLSFPPSLYTLVDSLCLSPSLALRVRLSQGMKGLLLVSSVQNKTVEALRKKISMKSGSQVQKKSL